MAKKKKKVYKKPQLKKHGKIKDLTTGGSGMMQEMFGMMGASQLTRFP